MKLKKSTFVSCDDHMRYLVRNMFGHIMLNKNCNRITQPLTTCYDFGQREKKRKKKS